ncbi:hypothetical protein LCGC14_1208560 [marine sediment metagenome]|uniref:PD-(D/E)XK endonuclease-like domain-containing protein n=1 Tax=marine sediment metagenome TaxID=412755 RepID=A0A0F9LER4_9ZZZZ
MTIRLSASSIKDFIQCERRFLYRRDYSEEGRQTKPMLVGSIAHRIIEEYWDDKEAAVEYCRDIRDKYPYLLEKDRNNLLLFTHTYFEKFRFMLTDQDEIEKRFKIEYKDYNLVGKIDRIVHKNGGTVIDWKSGVKTPRNINDDIQFILYYKAFQSLYGRAPTNVLLLSLSSGKMVTYKHNLVNQHILMEQIIPSMIQKIKRNEFPYTGVLNHKCYPCIYKEFCHQRLGK